MTENLQVSIVADVSQYKRGMNEAKQSTKNFSNESKDLSGKIEVLQATINNQQARLGVLKEKYDKLVASQKGSVAAVKDLEAKMKLLNTQITINQQKLETAITANNAFNDSLNKPKSVEATGTAMSDLQGTLENIRNLNMANVFTNMFAALAIAKDDLRKATSAFKNFGEELKGAFDFKNFDVDNGLKGIFQSMKIQGKEAIKSLGTAFKNLGKTIQSAMKTGVAAIASVIAALITFITLMKNAINTAQRLKTVFYEAQKIGMSATAYEEWAYIMGQVGVEVDALSDFLKTLADEQNAVRDGSEDIIKAFEAIGLSAEQVGNMSQEALFTATVKGLQNLESEVQRTSIAYRIFGEDAAQLNNVLNLTSEEMDRMINNYRLLGGTASDSAIEKSLTLSAAINDLKTAWRGLTNTLGEGFMPMIISVVRWLTKAIATVNMFVRAIFGFEIIASGSKSTEKATNSIGGYSNAMEKATEAAKQLKRTTQGFDELNIVNDPNKSSGAGSDSIGGGGFDMSDFNMPDLDAKFADLGLDKIAEKIDKWKSTLRAIIPAAMVAVGAVGGVLAALSGNWPLAIALFAMAGLGLVAMTSGEGGFQGYVANFTQACNGLLVPAMIGIGAVGGVIALLMGNIPLAIGLFAMAGIGVALTATDGFQALTNGFAQKITLIALVSMTAIGAVGGVIALLMGNIPLAIGLFAMAGIGIAGLTVGGFWDEIGAWFGELFAGIGQWCADVWDGICKVFEGVGKWFKDVFDAAWKGIQDAWKAVVKWFSDLWESIKKVWNAVGQWFSQLFKDAWEGIKKAWNAVAKWFSDLWEGIKKVWNAVKTWFSDIFKKAWDGIKAAWNGVSTWFSNIWNGIKTTFSNVKTWFSDIFKGAWEGIKKAFSNVSSFFTNIWTTIKNIFSKIGSTIGNAVSTAFKSAINWVVEKAVNLINGFIKSLNWAIGVINKIPGVNIKTISQLSVPKLATGGIVMGDTLAHIGEGGKREAVLPLDQNTGWMDMLADRIAERNNTPSKIVLQVGEKELGWATINSINSITKQTGRYQLHLV